MDQTPENPILSEPLVTLKEAAKKLGIPYYKLQRAAKLQLVPTYRLLNGRLYVLLSEILRVMARRRK